ncbi:MAG: S16 family serine protease [Kineosporiaceae bacterium]
MGDDAGAQDSWAQASPGAATTGGGQGEGFPAPWPDVEEHPPSRWTPVVLLATPVVIVLSAVLALVGVPYVVLEPGPVRDTLGGHDGRPLITVQGSSTYPTTGELDLTTVSIQGGPGRRLSLFTALEGWLRGDWAVYPEEAVFPKGQTAQQAKEESQTEMADSQSSAKAAALRELGLDVPMRYVISSFVEGSPAQGPLEVGDVVLSVDGRPADSAAAIRDQVRTHRPGDASSPVRLRVRRGGRERDVTVVPAAGEDGAAALRVMLGEQYDFPFTVDIRIDDIGGPSAGTMFALGIIDKLTPGAMTGGRRIAGTGTIDGNGVVGPIGGIRQKVIGARRHGAEVFLAPADNCADLTGHVPDGLTVYRVSTLHEARTVVEAVGARRGVSAPRCG